MQGWRTFLLNALAAASIIVLEIVTMLVGVDWQAHLPREVAIWIVVAVNIANIVLRHVTSGPAGWRNGATPGKEPS
uniref:hypothetical protein n=1 Tax=Stappia sp. TaxID=1870903 RepID=UPI003BA9CAEF